MGWRIEMDESVSEWIGGLDTATQEAVIAAAVVLGQEGPALGRPLVDTITGSRIPNMKELRPPAPGRQVVRILFVFDPRRVAILLVAGDKSGDWKRWYKQAIPLAERRYWKHVESLRRGKEK